MGNKVTHTHCDKCGKEFGPGIKRKRIQGMKELYKQWGSIGDTFYFCEDCYNNCMKILRIWISGKERYK